MIGLMGKKVFISTVTKYFSGLVVEETDSYLKLDQAAWIADTGRFADAMADTDKFSEVEPYTNPVWVFTSGIIDITEIAVLPTKQK